VPRRRGARLGAAYGSRHPGSDLVQGVHGSRNRSARQRPRQSCRCPLRRRCARGQRTAPHDMSRTGDRASHATHPVGNGYCCIQLLHCRSDCLSTGSRRRCLGHLWPHLVWAAAASSRRSTQKRAFRIAQRAYTRLLNRLLPPIVTSTDAGAVCQRGASLLSEPEAPGGCELADAEPVGLWVERRRPTRRIAARKRARDNLNVMCYVAACFAAER